MEKENIKLNENDNKLLSFCMNRRRSVNDISRHLSITPASVSSKIEKLVKVNLLVIERQGHGKKTYVRTKKGIKIKEYYIKILKELKKRGGEISTKEYLSLLPFILGDPDPEQNFDRYNAPIRLRFTDLVEERIKITKKGEEFLKSPPK